MKYKILLVDDNRKLGKNLKDYFNQHHIALNHSLIHADALSMACLTRPNLILLDVTNKEVKCFETYRVLRLKTDVPILILTEPSHSIKEIDSKIVETDEYIHKPFEPNRLLIQVKGMLQRTNNVRTGCSRRNLAPTYSFRNLEINKKSKTVTLLGEDIELTKIEYQVLYFLASNPIKTFTREEIFNAVKDVRTKSNSETTDCIIKKLQKRIVPLDYIKPVLGSGYSFVPIYDID